MVVGWKSRLDEMKKTLFIVPILFLTFLNGSQFTKEDKITLSKEVQDYLFSTQEILQEYISILDEIFTLLRDTLDYRDYKSFSNQLTLLNVKLMGSKERMLNTVGIDLSDREKKLVEVMNQYVDKLSKTISQLNYVSSKLIDILSYPSNEYSDDINKFWVLRDDYMIYREKVNTLLEDFLITQLPE